MKICRTSDRHNVVLITRYGAFLYQQECTLENDIKCFSMINYNTTQQQYLFGGSFYEYEIKDERLFIDLESYIYVC